MPAVIDLWHPFFSAPVLMALGVVALSLAVYAYVRVFRSAPVAASCLVVVRICLLVAILVLLCGPSYKPPPTRVQGTGDLLVLLDASASMQAKDMDGLTRYDFAVRNWLDAAHLKEWAISRTVRLYHTGEQVREVSDEQIRKPAAEAAQDNRSYLARNMCLAIDGVKEVRPGTAALFLSDGHDSEEESFADAARRAVQRGIPVYTVCLGGLRLERDLHLVAVTRQEFLFAKEEGQISVRIVQSNAARDRTMLRVIHNGATKSVPIAFEGRPVVTVDLPVKHDKAGVYEYRLEVDPVADEVELRNNAQVLFVQVADRRIRALLVEGAPHWETKFLAEALRRDDRIALTQVSQLSKTRVETLTSRVTAAKGLIPGTPRELDAYDVIILGKHVERVLSADVLAYLPDYVDRRGGSVLFARGRATDGEKLKALALIEPMTWPVTIPESADWVENGKWKTTASGGLHPIFHSDRDFQRVLAELPPFPRTTIARAKAGAQVLAVIDGGTRPSDGSPALAVMGIGNGKSMMLLSEGVWTWKMLSSGGSDWRNLYDRFWSNCARWLALCGDFVPGEQMALHLSHQSVGMGETVMIDAFARYVDEANINLQLTVRDPDGRAQKLTLEQVDENRNHQRASYRPVIPGVHTIILDGPGLDPPRRETGLNVFAIDEERLRSAAMPEALRRLADDSGGKFLDARHPERFSSELRRAEEASLVPAIEQQTWPRMGLLLLLLTWAGVEWILRRAGGLL